MNRSARLTDEMTVRLSDTAEARRLRAMLKVAQEQEGSMIGLVELTWTNGGFHVVTCAAGDETEVGRALGKELGDFNYMLGLMVQAMRDVLPSASIKRVNARAQELLEAVDAQRKRESEADA